MWELFVVVVQNPKICRFLDSLHIILSLRRGTLEEKCRRPSSSNSQLPKWLTSANDESRVSFPIYSRSSGPRSLASEGSGVLAPGSDVVPAREAWIMLSSTFQLCAEGSAAGAIGC
jgi:hypothetical protein